MRRWLVVGAFLAGITVPPENGWTPLWNGTNLDGWTT
jgi:hypothetical protein